jgi:carbon monoxide dehydrogenase subunit G
MLKSCIPGCDSIEPDGQNAYRMQLAARVGPVSARFSGKMRMADIDAAERAYTLRFEGTGGPAGFVNGEAHVTLTQAPDGTTTLAYVAKAQVGGKLAQVGSRLIDGAAHKMTDEFFAHFVEACVPPAPPVVIEPERKRPWTVYGVIAVALIGLLYVIIRR